MTTQDARTPASTRAASARGARIGWHKGYLEGSRPDLRVPVRQVHLTNGRDVTLYDTSGPYTDPSVETDVRRGPGAAAGELDHRPRRHRGVRGPPGRAPRTTASSTPRRAAGCATSTRSSPAVRGCRAAGRDGRPVTQLAYARRGEITPEMEYVGAARGRRPRGRARGDRRRPGRAAGERQPPGDRADDHRQALPGEGQRQHRQLRGHLLHRGGGREDDLGHPLGRRHGHGPVHRPQHPHHPRVDAAQLPGADRHRAALPGAGEGRRPGRGADLGDLQGHRHRAGRAGRRLHDRARRRAAARTSR